MDQLNRIENRKISPLTYEHLSFDKNKPKLYNGKKKASSTNGVGITGCRHIEK